MEQHAENPEQFVVAIIPARMASTRLPGKMLREIVGRPLVLHTLDRATAAKTVSRVIVATDSQEIFDAVAAAGGEAAMTSRAHRSGSDRIAEVATGLPVGSIVVNVQGDEPLISPDTIDLAVGALISEPSAQIATTCEAITDAADVIDSNIVKVVTDKNGFAIYFSRSPIPFPRSAKGRFGDWGHTLVAEPGLLAEYRKHTGLYVYRREYLLEFTKLPPSRLEMLEKLEQLRALENGAKIKVVEAVGSSIGVDTEDDLERVRLVLEAAVPSI